MIISNHPRGPVGHLELQCNESASHKPLLLAHVRTRVESQVPIRLCPHRRRTQSHWDLLNAKMRSILKIDSSFHDRDNFLKKSFRKRSDQTEN